MPRALGRAAAAALVVGVTTLAGCTSAPPVVESPGARWQRTHAALDSLGALGLEHQALRALADARAIPDAPAWLVEDLAASEAAWQRRAALADSARAALRLADHALARAVAMMAHDSLAAAVALARRAVATRDALLGEASPGALRAAAALGEIAFRMSLSGEVDSLARRVMQRLPEAARDAHPLAAAAEELRGRVLKNFAGSQERDSVVAHYARALAIRERAFGARSLEVAAVHHELGNMERMARRTEAALAHFEQALAIRRERLGARHDQVASTLSAMAYLSASVGEWHATERSMRASLAASPAPDALPPATAAMRHGLLGQALRRLGRTEESIAPLERAVAAAETTWARSERDANSSVQSGLSIHRELAMALAAEGRGEAAFEALERGTARGWAATLAGDPWRGLLARVQSAMTDDMALVAWPRTTLSPPGGDYPMWACVVRARGPVQWVRLERHPRWAGRDDSPREALLLEVLRASKWPLRVFDTRVVDSLAQEMGRERFAPLAPHLTGARRIVVFGPDLVGQAPLALLRGSAGEWLGDQRTIHYAPSALAFTVLAARPRAATHGAWLVGAPTAGAADSGRWAPLAGAADELRGLAGLFPEATVLTGADASAARLREAEARGALRHASVLHLATHTQIEPSRAMQSAFVLAPDAASGAHSSRLEASEVARQWRLDARLVSLASCQSALGLSSASEGFLGLQSALLSAGARSVLVSMWRVEDEATARLMHTFYAALQSGEPGMDAAAALQRAQRAVRTWRDPQGRTPYAHPVYWAGFALVGSGE